MLLDEGEIIHVIERRGFESDVRRHFLGRVQRVTDTAVRVEGYSFVFDSTTGTFERTKEKRIRIIPLADTLYIINILPPEADIEAVKYNVDRRNRMVATDSKTFELCINEFSAIR